MNEVFIRKGFIINKILLVFAKIFLNAIDYENVTHLLWVVVPWNNERNVIPLISLTSILLPFFLFKYIS